MVSPQIKDFEVPIQQGPRTPIIVGWTMVVTTTPAWGIEPTTSSLGVMSPYHQAKARGVVGRPASTTHHNKIITGVNFLICKGLRAKKLGIFDKSRPIRFDKALFGNLKIDPFGP